MNMKRSFFIWAAISACVMLLLPWLSVTFVKADAGMAAIFLLFYAVNPAYSVAVGIVSGNNMRGMWALPLISAVLFLMGVWIFFDLGEVAFVGYAAGYLVIGAVSMLATALVRTKLHRSGR